MWSIGRIVTVQLRKRKYKKADGSSHLSLPEFEEFLQDDLTKDASKDLAYAEQAHKKENVKCPTDRTPTSLPVQTSSSRRSN